MNQFPLLALGGERAPEKSCAAAGRGSRYSGGMRVLRVVVAVLLLAAWAQAGEKDKKPKIEVLPDKLVEVADPGYVAAGEPCPTWGWAATMQAMLARQGVHFTQEHWLFKVYGGTRCLEIGDLANVASQVTGDYRDETGKQFHVEFKYEDGAPRLMDDILVSLKNERPLVVIWKGHPYLLQGVLYSEGVSNVGARFFTVKELRLLDPYVAEGEGHAVVFHNPEDDANEINGTYQVTATEILGPDWLRQRTK
jgi:hypothetical protein